MMTKNFHMVGSEAIDGLPPEPWDTVVAQSGTYLSRSYLRLLEQHLPPHLSVLYAMVFKGTQPVIALSAQCLDIRVANLSGHPIHAANTWAWQGIGKASQRSMDRARNQLVFYDSLLPWPLLEAQPAPEDEGELWPIVVSDLWHRFRALIQETQQLIGRGLESSVAWVHLHFIVCGSLLSTGPHGMAFRCGEDPDELWPVALEALEGMRRLGASTHTADMLMVKDLTACQHAGEPALIDAGYSRFETEPNMVLALKPSWKCLDDYLMAIKSHYRSEVRKSFQELAAADIQLETLAPDTVPRHAAELYQCYLQVHDHQKLRLATITPEWIPALAGAYPEDHCTLVARHRPSGRIVGFITLLKTHDTAVGTWIGFDKTLAAKGIPLYRALIYHGIHKALTMGVSSVALGRTALEPKANLGAEPESMFCYLRHRSPALNLAVPSILALLPDPQSPPERHPFKG